MKKIVICLAVVCAAIKINAQESNKTGIRVNTYVGLPVGYASNHSDINLGISIGYLGPINDIIKVGGHIGYDYSNVRNDSRLNNKSTFNYLMIGGSTEIDVYKNLYFGADLGYAFGQGKKTSGTHYFTPKLGYHYNELMDFYLHYKGVRFNGYQVASVGAGVAFKF